MVDDEFVRIAVFQLEQCAKALHKLSERVQSALVRERLLLLSAQLAANGSALAGVARDHSTDE